MNAYETSKLINILKEISIALGYIDKRLAEINVLVRELCKKELGSKE